MKLGSELEIQNLEDVYKDQGNFPFSSELATVAKVRSILIKKPSKKNNKLLKLVG